MYDLDYLVIGIFVIVVGRFKLASYLQYLPLPVIGGYLAYIGFFCGQAGIAMMSGKELVSISDWHKIFNSNVCLFVFIICELPKVFEMIIGYTPYCTWTDLWRIDLYDPFKISKCDNAASNYDLWSCCILFDFVFVFDPNSNRERLWLDNAALSTRFSIFIVFIKIVD